uniref:Uncharacterized protein n=1 Tax=Arundo donax TaxID=35708 RepID=A0A0A9DTV7_ARUDO
MSLQRSPSNHLSAIFIYSSSSSSSSGGSSSSPNNVSSLNKACNLLSSPSLEA